MKINSVNFGQVEIDKEKYGDVLIIDGKIIPRDIKGLQKIFGTTHRIAHGEVDQLFWGNPEIIIIGDGINDTLKIDHSSLQRIKAKGVIYYILPTKEAVEKINELFSKKKVNALIHTT